MFLSQIKPNIRSLNLKLSGAQIFMLSAMIVNGVNYLYNVLLGRISGPKAFADIGLMLTLLLVVSFIGMTFQLVATRFAAELEGDQITNFKTWLKKKSFLAGLGLSIPGIIFSSQLSSFLQLSNPWLISVFALGLPFYFLMSSERGFLQGKEAFTRLSVSYQVELWAKVICTFILILTSPKHAAMAVTAAILVSIIAVSIDSGQFLILKVKHKLSTEIRNKINTFFLFTLGYELIQMLINYGDMIMVKHYFDQETAGLYTAMSLVGRMIYFITWMLVMILIPKVLQKKKQGVAYKHILIKYAFAIGTFSGVLVLFTMFFPETSISLLFGEEYIPFASYLWQYGLATAFFALANLFIYYFITCNKYWVVFIAGFVSTCQLVLYTIFNTEVLQIIEIQMICMGILMLIMIGLFLKLERN